MHNVSCFFEIKDVDVISTHSQITDCIRTVCNITYLFTVHIDCNRIGVESVFRLIFKYELCMFSKFPVAVESCSRNCDEVFLSDMAKEGIFLFKDNSFSDLFFNFNIMVYIFISFHIGEYVNCIADKFKGFFTL